MAERSKVRPISVRSYLVTACVASLASLLLIYSKPATVRVDGQRIASDVAPVIGVRERYLPLRAVALGLGAVTSFEPRNGRIEIMRGRDTVVLRVGERKALLNGASFSLSHAPFVVRGRVMVPSRLFERALRSDVHYDGLSQTIELTPRAQEP